MGERFRAAAAAAVRAEYGRIAAEARRLDPRPPSLRERPTRPGTRPCPRCAAPVPVVKEVEVTNLGSPVPQYLPAVLGACPTEGCGTTCVTCHRKPGEVHGPHCWERMRWKIEDPHIVDRSDCLAEVARG